MYICRIRFFNYAPDHILYICVSEIFDGLLPVRWEICLSRVSRRLTLAVTLSVEDFLSQIVRHGVMSPWWVAMVLFSKINPILMYFNF